MQKNKFNAYIMANSMMIHAVTKYCPNFLSKSQKEIARNYPGQMSYKEIKRWNYAESFQINLIADYYKNKANNRKSLNNFKKFIPLIPLFIYTEENKDKHVVAPLHVYSLLITTEAQRFYIANTGKYQFSGLGKPYAPFVSDGNGSAYRNWSNANGCFKRNKLKRSNTRLLHSALHCKPNLISGAELHSHNILFSFGKTDLTDASVSNYFSKQLGYQVNAHLTCVKGERKHNDKSSDSNGNSFDGCMSAAMNMSGSDSEDVSLPDASPRQDNERADVVVEGQTCSNSDLVGGKHMSDLDVLRAMGSKDLALYVIAVKNSAHGTIHHPLHQHYNFSFAMAARHLKSEATKARRKAQRDAVPRSVKLARAGRKRWHTMRIKRIKYDKRIKHSFMEADKQVKMASFRSALPYLSTSVLRTIAHSSNVVMQELVYRKGNKNLASHQRKASLDYAKEMLWTYYDKSDLFNSKARVTVPLQNHAVRLFKESVIEVSRLLNDKNRNRFMEWAHRTLPTLEKESGFVITGARPAKLTRSITGASSILEAEFRSFKHNLISEIHRTVVTNITAVSVKTQGRYQGQAADVKKDATRITGGANKNHKITSIHPIRNRQGTNDRTPWFEHRTSGIPP